MARRPGVQILRNPRIDGTTTFALRVRVGGADDILQLGNSADGWDESRVERARAQLLAKIELGLWKPGSTRLPVDGRDNEPTFRELATDWFMDRRGNPAVRPRTVENDHWKLTRFLLPFFGELRPSQITAQTVKKYRRHLHQQNAQIRAAAETGKPLRDRRGQRLRPLGNRSMNSTLQTLAAVLDEAEDAGWVERNVARGRRTREPVERKKRDALEPDEFLSLLEAADELDRERHLPGTLDKAKAIRALRDDAGMPWRQIAERFGVAPTTAMYLYKCEPTGDPGACGPRRAVVATLGLAGLRVTELCQLDRQHVNLATGTIHVRDSKTEAGVRKVDIRPRLLDDLSGYRAALGDAEMDSPAFPTNTSRRRTKDNVRSRIVLPVLARANQVRARRGEPPILAHLTPHTFRRTYITFMLAAGFDLAYVQAQVGHRDPAVTLGIYAQVIRRADRDELRAEMRALLDERPARDVSGPVVRGPSRWESGAKRQKKAVNANDEPSGPPVLNRETAR
jgi:integrase